ncbi:hypothetical protein [Oceanihabitans sediminis]|uniref:hypothetical protein n=1 Tax=Oceanihabitans sediminis TaxID=1812012 RepID=UPI00299E6665|nr:hypothetical protein [Oceanihabitans sediminis]MDX1279235.1 hypothetical protein [Oceanihabitans sediminis]
MRRDDKRAIPLIVYASEMVSYGFDMQYVIDCMEKNYDGRKLNTYGVIDNGI